MTGDRPIAFLMLAGEPLPKGRPRAKAGQQPFTPPATRAAEKRVREAFVAKYPEWIPLEGLLTVTGEFFRTTMRAVDVDNLLKLVTDALNGIAWVDDSQIDDLRGIRHLGCGAALARTVIRIGYSA